MSEYSFSDRKLETLLDQQQTLWLGGDAVGLARANDFLLDELQNRQPATDESVAVEPPAEPTAPVVSPEAALELQMRAFQSHDQALIALANDMVQHALQGIDSPRP